MTFLSRAMLVLTVLTATTALVAIDAQEAHAQKRKKGKVKGLRPMGGIRGGFILAGSGELTAEGGGTSITSDYDDESLYALNAFAAWPVAKSVRVGGSVWVFPAVDLRPDGAGEPDETDFGLDINLLGEYVMPLGTVDGFAYGEAGLSTIFQSDDGDDQTDEVTGLGFNIGAGVGAQFLVSSALAARADLKFSYYSVNFENELGDQTITTTAAGTRILLNVGIAFGL
ncbi:MAG: hypothetical protein AAFS10_17065 [Myxococcota bacterium]